MFRSLLPSIGLAFFTLGLTPSICAQELPSFRFGLKVAPNVGSIRADSDELEFSETGTSINFGVLGDIRFSDDGHWWISTGMLVTNIHSSFVMDATVDHGPGPTEVDGQIELRTRYLEFPATLKWRTTSSGPLDFCASLGYGGAFHLRSSVRGTRTLTSPPGSVGNTTDYDGQNVSEEMASFKSALIAGAGIEYTLDAGPTFFGGVTYSKALTSAMQKSAGTFVLYGGSTQLYPDYAELSLGVFF